MTGQKELLQKETMCTALWLIVHDGEKIKVLLQKHNEQRNGSTSKLYTPLFTDRWFQKSDYGNTLSIIRQEAKYLFGESFVQNHLTRRGYPFPNLLLVDNKEFEFGDKRKAVRLHYFGKITEDQLKEIQNRLHHLFWETPFPHTERVVTKTITSDDCHRMFELGSVGAARNDSIVLFHDDFNVIFPFLENDAAEMRFILKYDWP